MASRLHLRIKTNKKPVIGPTATMSPIGNSAENNNSTNLPKKSPWVRTLTQEKRPRGVPEPSTEEGYPNNPTLFIHGVDPEPLSELRSSNDETRSSEGYLANEQPTSEEESSSNEQLPPSKKEPYVCSATTFKNTSTATQWDEEKERAPESATLQVAPTNDNNGPQEEIKTVTARNTFMGIIVSMGGLVFGYGGIGQIGGFLLMPDYRLRFGDEYDNGTNGTEGVVFSDIRAGTIVGMVRNTPFPSSDLAESADIVLWP
jgi:hypothetical protein